MLAKWLNWASWEKIRDEYGSYKHGGPNKSWLEEG